MTDSGLILGPGRSSGVGNGNPLQYASLENSMDRGAWEATVYGAAKTPLSVYTRTHAHTHPEKVPDGVMGFYAQCVHNEVACGPEEQAE